MKIAIASDHAGFDLKSSIIKEFIELHKSLRRNTSTLILDVLKKYI